MHNIKMHNITPEEMTRIVFGDYEEVFFGKSEADSWLREIGKRIGRKLCFRTFKFMDEKYQFIVGMFDENGNVLIADAPSPWCRMKLKEISPAYLDFYVNSGTIWDMNSNEAKMECLSYLRKKFYLDYTIEIVSEKSIMLDRVFSHYMISDGKAFDPIPEAESLAGLVFNMDMMKYGRQ